MMKKLLTIVMGLGLAFGASAQTESTITASDILYWVGSGSQSAIFVIDYGTGAVAWGYHFDASGNETVEDMATAISDADPRMYYGYGMLSYVAYPADFESFDGVYSFKVDGELADYEETLGDYDLEDGMLVKVSESTDEVWSTTITPATVMATPVDATIAASAIQYWVGEGSDSLVFAVNWGNPDTALAWGLKFDGPLTISGALAAVCAADERLSSNDPFTTITFANGDLLLDFDTVSSFTNVPQFILNGNGNVNVGTSVENGDFLKIGESHYGFGFDSVMGYAMGVVWPTEIHPVNVPAADTVQPIHPNDATIAADQILYWVGSGNNSVILAINWADTALAWGYRFSDSSITVDSVMNDIAAADPRFSYTASNGWLLDIVFDNGEDSLHNAVLGNWMSTVNGNSSISWGMSSSLTNGDIFKWGDMAAATNFDSIYVVDSAYGNYWMFSSVFTAEVHPVSVPDTVQPQPVHPVDATIAADQILYWVGSGNNSVIFAVNWADTALAWGYRFSDSSITVDSVMNDIAAADPRFSYTASNGWLLDIVFDNGEDSLHNAVLGNWMSTVNGNSSISWGMSSSLANGDIFKWGDMAVATNFDSIYVEDSAYGNYWMFSSVFTTEVHPVSVPDTTHEGISTVADVEVSVYPNPATEWVNVRFDALGNDTEAAMYDLNGRRLFVRTIEAGATGMRIDTNAMPNGIYMLRIGAASAKVVVRH